VKWPCFYGIDFASPSELIAAELDVEQICKTIGADSLGYIPLDELIEACGVPRQRLCRACFDGEYPVQVDDSARLGKHQLEVING